MTADRLAGDLDHLADALRGLDQADEEAAQLIATAAPGFTHRVTGLLAANTRAVGPSVVNAAPYAAFEDARHPFLTPAADSVDWTAPHMALIDEALNTLEGTY